MEEEDGNGALGAEVGDERLATRVGVDIAVKSVSFWIHV